MSCFFFFNDTATTEIYTLSLHDALPISPAAATGQPRGAQVDISGSDGTAALSYLHAVFQATRPAGVPVLRGRQAAYPFASGDRKSTRLNSSHANISYAVFCLKKKKK